MKSKASQLEAEIICSDLVDDDIGGRAGQRSHLWTMLSRAAVVYLVLFMGLGLVMSVLGVNPMINNGLMPKLLFVFVGLALVIALANTLTDLLREQGQNWLRLIHRRAEPGTGLEE